MRMVVGIWLLSIAWAFLAWLAELGSLWPEMAVLGLAVLAGPLAVFLAPGRRIFWVLGSPLISALAVVVLWIGLFGSVSWYAHRATEAWLAGLFSGAREVPTGDISCHGRGSPVPCNLAAYAELHGGLGKIDCFDNLPLSARGFECSVALLDGTALAVDAGLGWSNRWAAAYFDEG